MKKKNTLKTLGTIIHENKYEILPSTDFWFGGQDIKLPLKNRFQFISFYCQNLQEAPFQTLLPIEKPDQRMIIPYPTNVPHYFNVFTKHNTILIDLIFPLVGMDENKYQLLLQLQRKLDERLLTPLNRGPGHSNPHGLSNGFDYAKLQGFIVTPSGLQPQTFLECTLRCPMDTTIVPDKKVYNNNDNDSYRVNKALLDWKESLKVPVKRIETPTFLHGEAMPYLVYRYRASSLIQCYWNVFFNYYRDMVFSKDFGTPSPDTSGVEDTSGEDDEDDEED